MSILCRGPSRLCDGDVVLLLWEACRFHERRWCALFDAHDVRLFALREDLALYYKRGRRYEGACGLVGDVLSMMMAPVGGGMGGGDTHAMANATAISPPPVVARLRFARSQSVALLLSGLGLVGPDPALDALAGRPDDDLEVLLLEEPTGPLWDQLNARPRGFTSSRVVPFAANLEVAARRAVWGTFTNAGQTCIRPDYMMVHASVADELVAEMKKASVR